jgi:uncharacterized membrane protein YphA (DoxX/SURF4 family)
MITGLTQMQEKAAQQGGQPFARYSLALMRVTIGTMFVWVFFENLGKDLYQPSNYADLIKGYIENGSSPALWKHVMAFMASQASVVAPLQGFTEISLGVLLVLGVLTRPAALVAFGFLASLWVSEWGSGWIWELLVPVLACLSIAIGSAGRTWGIDSFLARKRPNSLFW